MISRSRLKSKQSKKYVERTKMQIILVSLLSIFCLAIYGFSLTRFINLEVFDIRAFNISGADPDIAPQLEAAAIDALQGEYLGALSRSSTLVYPSRALQSVLEKASPRIFSVSLKRRGLQALTISVKEKTPAALVCANLPDFDGSALSFGESDNCYFADQTGYVFKAAPSFSENIYNRYYLPNLASNISSSDPTGTFATSTEEFLALQGLFKELKSLSIAAEAILMKDAGEYELYVRNPSQTGTASTSDSDMAVVYFDDSRPFKEQISNFISFWKDMTDKAYAKHEPLSFEYIDIRYGSNVFYRLNK